MFEKTSIAARDVALSLNEMGYRFIQFDPEEDALTCLKWVDIGEGYVHTVFEETSPHVYKIWIKPNIGAEDDFPSLDLEYDTEGVCTAFEAASFISGAHHAYYRLYKPL